MATKQYIGARYVPLFADPIAHDTTRTYDPLTIVISGGNSYTSRQFVPAGIPITDTTYWALTGNYNAQIDQYRSETALVQQQLASKLAAVAHDASLKGSGTTTDPLKVRINHTTVMADTGNTVYPTLMHAKGDTATINGIGFNAGDGLAAYNTEDANVGSGLRLSDATQATIKQGNDSLTALHAETTEKATLLYRQIQQGSALGMTTAEGIRIGHIADSGAWEGYSLLVRPQGGVDVLNGSGDTVARMDMSGIQYYDSLLDGLAYAASTTSTVSTEEQLPAAGVEKQTVFVTEKNRLYVWHDGKWRLDGGYVVKQMTWVNLNQNPHGQIYVDVMYAPESGYVTLVLSYDRPINGLAGGFSGKIGDLPLPLCPISDNLRAGNIWIAEGQDYEVNMVLSTGTISFRTANNISTATTHYPRGIITYPCRAGAWATDARLGVPHNPAEAAA